MSDRAKIITIYVVVGILSAGVLGTSMWIRHKREAEFGAASFEGFGKTEAEDFGTLEEDLELVNQEGETVHLSDLKDKVWVATNFFAECDQCLKSGSTDLQRLYEEFGSNPDFHIVSITVNPGQDDVKHLKEYATALNADSRNWWFLRGPEAKVHEYVEKQMKFMKVTRNPPEAARLYSHDLGLQVYDRGWKRVKKRDLQWARNQSEAAHDAYYEELRSTIEKRLEAGAGPAADQPSQP